jgi:hypothetical protein
LVIGQLPAVVLDWWNRAWLSTATVPVKSSTVRDPIEVSVTEET